MADLVSIELPITITTIGENAFFECVKLVELINHSPLNIEVGSSDNGCVGLHALTIHKGTTRIQSKDDFLYIETTQKTVLLSYLGNKTDVILPTLNNPYEIQECAFYQRKDIKKIDIPNQVVSIGSAAFYQCEGLTFVKIPNSVTTVSMSAFCWCTNLVSIELGTGVTQIDDYAFMGCSKLVEVINNSSINIVAGTTSNGQIGQNALVVHNGSSYVKQQGDYLFYECGNTVYLLGYTGNDSELTLPNKYNNKAYSLYKCAFDNNQIIERVIIPDGVLGIGSWAFSDCYNLEYVYIGKDVSYIDRYAFSDCTMLSSVELSDTTGWWYSSNKDDINGTDISSASIMDNSIAANYLTDKYYSYYWHKD